MYYVHVHVLLLGSCRKTACLITHVLRVNLSSTDQGLVTSPGDVVQPSGQRFADVLHLNVAVLEAGTAVTGRRRRWRASLALCRGCCQPAELAR